jgi:peptidyl-prolyl cis-trans isomerase D
VILHVTKIIPAILRPFAEVADELKRDIGLQRAKRDIVKVHDAIEDQRSAGKTLTEAAKSAGFEVRTIEAIDASGRDQKGEIVEGLPYPQALLKAAFASDIGVDNDTLTTPDGGNVWFEVAGIDQARQKTFEEVKDQVETAWHNDAIVKRLAAKAGDLTKRLEASEKLSAIAEAEGLEMKHAGNVKRNGSEGLPPGAVAQIFNVGVGGAGSAADNASRIVFHVIDAVVPPIDMDAPDLAKLIDQVKTGLADDILIQYMNQLQTDLGVSINGRALKSASGAGGEID